MQFQRNLRKQRDRSGTTTVELALVVTTFTLMAAALVEFGHAHMVIATLTAAAKQSARFGAVDDITSAQVVAKATEVMGASFDVTQATVLVKNASVFDTSSDTSNIVIGSLPNIPAGGDDLDDLNPGDLFIVYITIPYDNVAIFPPFWAKSLTLTGRSVMRHE